LKNKETVIRSCTAEQFISHLLPPLAGIKGPNVTVKVEPDKVEVKKLNGNSI
jgi:hypothetical protein